MRVLWIPQRWCGLSEDPSMTQQWECRWCGEIRSDGMTSYCPAKRGEKCKPEKADP